MTEIVCTHCAKRRHSSNAMQIVSCGERCRCGGQWRFIGTGSEFTNWLCTPRLLATVDELIIDILGPDSVNDELT